MEMAQIFMPALSSTMTEGKISEWLMGVGDKVEVGDMVLVVESDKADMDVESFEEGYIAKILTADGETAAVGDPVRRVWGGACSHPPCSLAAPMIVRPTPERLPLPQQHRAGCAARDAV